MPTGTKPPPPRRTPPDQALPEPAAGISGVVGAGAAAAPVGTALGGVAGVAATAPGIPLIKAGQESIEKILEGLRAFFVLTRARHERWVIQNALGRLPQQDILELIAIEGGFQAEFERRVRERMERDLARIFQLPEEDRPKKIGALLRREQVYARQRSEAMAIRALGALDRAVLRLDSPAGAVWELGAHVVNHSPGCQLLAGRYLPWAALDELHPPAFHHGCQCKLRAPSPGQKVLEISRARLLVAKARAAEVGHGH